MRRVPALLAVLALATPVAAFAKPPTGEKPPARAAVPPAPPPRRVAPAPAAAILRPRSQTFSLQSRPALPPIAEQGVSGGALGAQPLIGLRSSIDPAPQCRSTCARARYFCASGGDGSSCDDGWRQCVLGCRAR